VDNLEYNDGNVFAKIKWIQNWPSSKKNEEEIAKIRQTKKLQIKSFPDWAKI
jgi:hypothetical protein